jgi:hypothetical protein
MEQCPEDIIRRISKSLDYTDVLSLREALNSDVPEFKGDHRWLKNLYELEHYTRSVDVKDPKYEDSMRWCERYMNNTFDADTGSNTWTDEQMSIINSDSDRVIVQAFAGTGKTSTLFEYVRRNPDKSMLYLAFNKELEVSATRKKEELGLKNISVSTTHAFALDYLKSKNMLSDNVVVGSVKCKDLVSMGYDRVTANDILRLLRSYCASDSNQIFVSPEYNEGFKKVLIEHTKRLWDSMFDGTMKMTHDVYFKFFQSTKPVLDYDVILVDEIQDCTPCQMDIVNRQKCKKILVGDIHQQIYRFRGVCDPFENARTLQLTKTFRFGFDVADLSNTFLRVFKNEHAVIKSPQQRVTKLLVTHPREKHTIICRTHAGVLDTAMKQTKPFFLLGMKQINVDKEIEICVDLKNMTQGRPHLATHRKLRDMTYTESNMLDVIADTYWDNQRWRVRVGMYKTHGDALLEMYERMSEFAMENIEDATVVITNVHQSKGLEFDHVVMGTDFNTLTYTVNDNVRYMVNPRSTEEYNLIYVAMTRARKSLTLNDQMFNFLRSTRRWGHDVILGVEKSRCVRCDTTKECYVVRVSEDRANYIGCVDPPFYTHMNVCSTCF